MTGAGLVGVPDPSELFGKTSDGEVGAAVACALEGTRPILLEIQSLVSPTDLAMPRRVGTGVDPKRLAMIVAVLAGTPASRSGRPTSSSTSRAASASTSPAPTSRSRSRSPRPRGAPVGSGLAAFGEIGLTGRLRAATQAERALEECAKLGLDRVIAPAGTPSHGKISVQGTTR